MEICQYQKMLNGGSIPLSHKWKESVDVDGCYKKTCLRCGFVSFVKPSKQLFY